MASITFWTRLEPFTRLDDIDAGLQARTHDPLWLLARQWQTGEFQGEDAGTPVQARCGSSARRSTRYRAGAAAPPSRTARRSRWRRSSSARRCSAADPRRDLRVAAEAGLYFLRLLDALRRPAAATKAAFVTEYALAAPARRRRRRPRRRRATSA